MLFGNHVFFLSLIFSKLNFFKYSVKSIQIESFPLPCFSILKCVTGVPQTSKMENYVTIVDS